ncbi:alpha/beta fold hydrolase [Amycolatopsis sp. PS_44_ISF1]|uniref:esterase/lipase family protein n=1 Tax=Amycolatopsis sp. PS_44_ISF1 TaxID=2974917 RepID=UPI0028E066BB|nr:alpha/beta fold hydrolase [Amycolatopsis sp. PS_44_ISF1]MDT8909560.1 alpha/beta fold hydrolase [Amycolatopsis sp. PS_44_ISF1]
MSSKHFRRGFPALLAAFSLAALAVPADAAARYPVTPNLASGIVQSLNDPSAPPPGVNVASCEPSAAHPRPVVLITGTFGNMTDDWAGLGPTLANAGYCVYSTPIGGAPKSVIQTVGRVPESAKQISAFVDRVRAETGAAKVDLVGHSQGGLIGEYYLKLLGGAAKVHSFVGLSPTTHGTTLLGLAYLAKAFPGGEALVGAACPACADQITGSPVVRAVGAGPIAQSDVDYTVIETHNEFVVTPAGPAAFIDEPGVHNLWLQDTCPADFADHAGLSYSKTVYGLVGNALDPGHATPVRC